MKTIKRFSSGISNIIIGNKQKTCLLIIFMVSSGLLFGQAHPGVDPTFGPGMNAPLDGGLITAIIAGAGLVAAFFKKRKDKE